jgi:hypothetical protein
MYSRKLLMCLLITLFYFIITAQQSTNASPQSSGTPSPDAVKELTVEMDGLRSLMWAAIVITSVFAAARISHGYVTSPTPNVLERL